MSDNQLQRDLKKSMPELIEFLGDQPTSSPEHTISKIALEHRMQKRLVAPKWILAIATIITLIATILINFHQNQDIHNQVQDLRNRIQQLQSDVNKE